jgi:hypothetical protein
MRTFRLRHALALFAPERIAGCVIESVLEQPVKFRFRP